MNHIGVLPSNSNVNRKLLCELKQTSPQSDGHYSPSVSDFVGSFYAVLRRWQSETAFYSDPDKITNHPSFLAMVANASKVLPLIIKELQVEPSLLVWVLDDAIGDKPYNDATVGNIPEMTNAWIAWAERDGLTI